jgi:peptide/nickel transport system permease protein
MAISTPVSVTRSDIAPPQRGQWQLARRRFLAHRLAVASALVLVALALMVLAAPLLSRYDPEGINLDQIFERPSWRHLMGTDSVGRDLATRILYGGRISLMVGVLAMTVAMTLGVLVGGIAGFYGRAVDGLLMRFVDMMFAFPRLFLLILFSVFFKGQLVTVVVVLGALSWMTVARLVRGAFLSLKQREFVEAARSVGARNQAIIWRHILPNALAPVIVAATLGVANAIIALDCRLPRPGDLPGGGVHQLHRRRVARRA